MMKINILRFYFFATILLLMSSLSFGQNDNKIFVMVHFEAGRDTSHPLINKILFDELGYPPDSLRTNNLYFQQAIWLSTVHMIETADTFNVKLTLAIQSQMAEYILQDTNKINLFKNWIDNGHEFAMHHHGIDHIDWGGYTNRFQGTSYPDDYLWLDKFQNSGLYRGNMDLSFSYLQQLATEINDTIVTGCITDTQIDKPDGIKYLTTGGGQSDLISIPNTVPIPNETLYFLRHYQVVSVYKDINNEIIVDDSINHQQSTQALNYVMSNINQIDDGEIMGIVYHVFDYYRFPDIYRDLFMFISQSAVNNQSIKCLMNNCNTTGIDENIKINAINIYPSPTNGVLTIQGEEMKSIAIIDINGQIIQQYSISKEQISLDISNQPPGIYVIKIITSNLIIVKKVILKG